MPRPFTWRPPWLSLFTVFICLLAMWYSWFVSQALSRYTYSVIQFSKSQESVMPPLHSTAENASFKKIQTFRTEYSPANVTHYESTKTGLTVIVVDQEGPIVHGSFALATEIHDDSGAPHTLEHLCFMGSKNYNYIGVLDKLGARAYSDNNAWTATDHTEYVLDSAGEEAFAQILPVYLEHIIAPLLTDASCYTEVHHVDGDGNDAGVVYSEMQARENNADLLMFSRAKRLLYPEGVGFRYDTFGVMDSLRVLTADRIRKYHQDVYQPKNLCVIIVGEVEHSHLLYVLENFENTILDSVPKLEAPFPRPWINSKQISPLQRSIIEIVEFPDEDESSGQITISFFGPSYVDHLLRSAMVVLLAYLAGSPASVLENKLVETEQLASAVYYENDIQPTTAIHFTLSSVATEDLEVVERRFFELLKEAAEKPIDMKYMQDCIQREKRQRKFYAETSGQFFTEPIVTDFLFGKRDGSTLRNELETLGEHDILQTWPETQWRHWLKTWFSEGSHVTVLGRPSAPLSNKLRIEENARIEARKARLGHDGLESLEIRLASAKAENAKEVPEALISRFEIPGIESIRFIETKTARSGTARRTDRLDNHVQQLVDRDTDLPLFVHFEHITSNFANLTVVIGTEVIPVHQRPLLAIYVENFFSSPMLRNGSKLGFEQVIVELERDTVSYDMESGSKLGNSETLAIKLEVEVEKYETAIRWLKDLMSSSVFEPERIKATTSRLLADIPDEKRDGSNMASAVELMIGTAPSSAARASNTLVKAVYLKRVKQILAKDPQTIIDQLKDINAALCTPSNFRILVTANVEKLQRPVSPWRILVEGLGGLGGNKPLMPLETRLSRLSQQGRQPGNVAYVIPIPAVESSFVLGVSKGPSSFDDPVLPALMVATSYLNVVEGPLWTAVRGTGLAYGTSFYRHIDSGQVSLEIYRSPDPLKAFFATRDVVRKLVTGDSPINTFTLEGAISSIVLGFAHAESTKASAAESSFVRQVMRGLPKDWPSLILERVRKVTVEELREAMAKVMLPIFEAKTSNLFITCAPIMEKNVVQGLEEAGFEPQVKPLAFFQDDYGLSGGKEVVEESGEDDESEDDASEGGEDDESEDGTEE